MAGMTTIRAGAECVLEDRRRTAPSLGGAVTDKVVIFVTAPNRRESKKIAHHLVKRKLAACVNISRPVESVYRWKGKIAEDKEFLLIIKSSGALFSEIKAEISKIHSYQTPEIICLPISAGSDAYLQWLSKSLKAAGSEKGT